MIFIIIIGKYFGDKFSKPKLHIYTQHLQIYNNIE